MIERTRPDESDHTASSSQTRGTKNAQSAQRRFTRPPNDFVVTIGIPSGRTAFARCGNHDSMGKVRIGLVLPTAASIVPFIHYSRSRMYPRSSSGKKKRKEKLSQNAYSRKNRCQHSRKRNTPCQTFDQLYRSMSGRAPIAAASIMGRFHPSPRLAETKASTTA